MGMMGVTRTNPDAGASRSRTLTSGFARWGRSMEGGITTFAGLGHAQRAPDYWELFSGTVNPKESSTTPSAFGTRVATISRNVDATTRAGEAAVSHSLDAHWRAEGSIAYVRGENDTDNTALAQMTPLQARLGLRWESGAWSAGGALRIVAAQNRVDPDMGNIVGQDIGPTGGFSTVSMNVGYKPGEGVALFAGWTICSTGPMRCTSAAPVPPSPASTRRCASTSPGAGRTRLKVPARGD
jgi:iron complex outermembrane receptor protein